MVSFVGTKGPGLFSFPPRYAKAPPAGSGQSAKAGIAGRGWPDSGHFATPSRKKRRYPAERALLDRGGRRLDRVRFQAGHHALVTEGIEADRTAAPRKPGCRQATHVAMDCMANDGLHGHPGRTRRSPDDDILRRVARADRLADRVPGSVRVVETQMLFD
jgi:hypothetical protein